MLWLRSWYTLLSSTSFPLLSPPSPHLPSPSSRPSPVSEFVLIDWWKMSIDQAFESGDRQHNEYISLEVYFLLLFFSFSFFLFLLFSCFRCAYHMIQEMVQSIQLINPKESPENIKKAYDWAASESKSSLLLAFMAPFFFSPLSLSLSLSFLSCLKKRKYQKAYHVT